MHTRYIAVITGALTLTSALAPATARAQSTDLTVHVTRQAPGRTVFEVRNAQVHIRKVVTPAGSETTMTTERDQFRLKAEQGRLTVTSSGGSAHVTTGSAEQMAQFMTVVQRSEAATKARDLLRQLGHRPRDIGQHMLLLTRVVLELGHGPSPALTQHREWVETERHRLASRPTTPRVVQASLQSGTSDKGPGECWDIYSKEAIRIADDFADCTDDLKWYDALGWSGCSLIYTLRAETALWWLVNCSGGFPFSG